MSRTALPFPSRQNLAAKRVDRVEARGDEPVGSPEPRRSKYATLQARQPDLLAVVKAAQAMSSELVTDQLIRTLLKEVLVPYRDATASPVVTTLEGLLARDPAQPGSRIQAKVLEAAPRMLEALWPALQADADAHAIEARNDLLQRGRREADELRRLLEPQKKAVGTPASRGAVRVAGLRPDPCH